MTQEEKEAQDSATWSTWLETYCARLEKDYKAAPEGKPEEGNFFHSSRLESLFTCMPQYNLSKSQGTPRNDVDDARRKLMNGNNPAFILRNHVAQTAIERCVGDVFVSWSSGARALRVTRDRESP